MIRVVLGSVSGALVVSALSAQSPRAQRTVPLILDHNRAYVDLTLRRRDGSARKARFLLDTEGKAFWMAGRLARDLGIDAGETSTADGRAIAFATRAPRASLDDFPLDLSTSPVAVVVDADNVLPAAMASQHAEGIVPAQVLSQYHIVFDYPRRAFTIAKPGVLQPRGRMSAMRLGPTGFAHTDIVIGDARFDVLINTGGELTTASRELLETPSVAHLTSRHPHDAIEGARGRNSSTQETIYLGALEWNGWSVKNLAVATQSEEVFERNRSGATMYRVLGSIGGNALRGFRLELDYPNQKLYVGR